MSASRLWNSAVKSPMDMIRLPADFRDFLRLLNSHCVEYLLVGGYAVCYHGHYRTTGDLDIWIAVSAENAAKMAQLVREFGFETPEVNESIFLQKGRMIRMGIEPVRIEILTEISGCDFAACFANRVKGSLDGEAVNIISLPDLIRNKLKTGRLKDLDDAQKLG
jgi:predicted nucleotidyltransferase